MTVCVATALALSLAPAAAALPTAGGSADETVAELRSRGYDVRVNSSTSVGLSECTVTGVHGLSDSNVDEYGHRIDPSQHSTVYVSVTCRPDG